MIVYKYQNKINKKIYIGVTVDEEQRRLSHQHTGYIFHQAIKKYGFDSFDYEVLFECVSRSEAYEWEKKYIEMYDSMVPNGYNITPGGSGTGSGEKSNRAILTEIQAKAIISDPRSHTAVAKELGVSRYTVSDIRNGRSWKYLNRSKAPNYDHPYAAKLTKKEAREIIASDKTAREIANLYDVSVSCVRDIRKGKYYSSSDRTKAPNYSKEVRKISLEQAKAIISDERHHAAVARDYGISASHVSDIRAGKIFRELDRTFAPKYKDGRSSNHARGNR